MIKLARDNTPYGAAHYVVKGLGEANEQRVLASLGYRPKSALQPQSAE